MQNVCGYIEAQIMIGTLVSKLLLAQVVAKKFTHFVRAVRDLFEEVQERSGNAISFGKCLRKDLESSVGFSFIRETKSHHKKRKL